MVTDDTQSGNKQKKQNLGGIVRAPAACEFRIDFPDRINMWEIAITGPKPPPLEQPMSARFSLSLISPY